MTPRTRSARARTPSARVVIAVALVAILAGAGLAIAQTEGVYEHVWAAQVSVGGDLGGELVQQVDESRVELERDDDGSWAGTVAYRDRIGVRDPSNAVTAQLAAIDLVLEGGDIEAGESAGGTFEGTIRLSLFEIDEVEDAFDDAALEEPGSEETYRVTGHWGAVRVGEDLVGEILYESARPLDGRMEGGREAAAAFNRASLENPDALGDAQTFVIETPADLGDTPGGDPADTGDGDSDGASPSFWEYVRMGAAGSDTGAMPAPISATAAARDLFEATPEGATPLPEEAVAIDIHVSGAYLDAKNRAAGLLDDEGPTDAVWDGGPAWLDGREETVRPVAPGDASLARFYAERLLDDLESVDVPGADDLRDEVGLVLAGGSGDAPAIKVFADVAAAVGREAASADVVLGTVDVARVVASAEIPGSGPLADAVLAWADDPAAPADARDAMRFEAEPWSDETTTAEGDTLVALVISRFGSEDVPPSIAWTGTAGTRSVAPATWLARRSPAGRLLWLAGQEGPVALTDGSLRGWAFQTERAWLVESGRIGRIVAVFDFE